MPYRKSEGLVLILHSGNAMKPDTDIHPESYRNLITIPENECPLPFPDRHEAGRILAKMLEKYHNAPDAVVLALPRGGVPVGFEVARHLHLPLDAFVVKKMGLPGREELAIGAVASGNTVILNTGVIESFAVSEQDVDRIRRQKMREVEEREREYQAPGFSRTLTGKQAILVDDGLATGATMRAAVEAVSRHEPARIVVAVPVAAESTCETLRHHVHELVCARIPETFFAVGQWYDRFDQVPDEEVRRLLARANHPPAPPPPDASSGQPCRKTVSCPPPGLPQSPVPSGADSLPRGAMGGPLSTSPKGV